MGAAPAMVELTTGRRLGSECGPDDGLRESDRESGAAKTTVGFAAANPDGLAGGREVTPAALSRAGVRGGTEAAGNGAVCVTVPD
jgi:hypothetical protein